MVAILKIATTVTGLLASSIPGSRHLRARDLSNVTIPLSTHQTALGSPTTPIAAVGIGLGVQNYTCSTNNVFVSTGAVATLIDMSDQASNYSFVSTVHNDLFNGWNNSDVGNSTVQQMIEYLSESTLAAEVLAQHYFIKNETGGISPVWDFRGTPKFQGVENAVFVGKPLASDPDVDRTKNVPWLHLGKASGDIADEVYRIFTVGGVAPPQCVYGTTEDISVKYVAQYWFYGGSLGLGPNTGGSNSSTGCRKRFSRGIH